MEERSVGVNDVVNIPIQMKSLTDRSGRITPLCFRFENREHEIIEIPITCVISRNMLNYAGIRENQYICRISEGANTKIIELRYSIDSQRWRIFQFLS